MGGNLFWEEILQIIIKYKLELKNFIETGTYKGHSIRELETYFDNLYTIELFEPLYNEAKSLCDKPHIHYYLGDSVSTLPKILENIKTPSLFFLDAHGTGDVKVPLLEELDIVLKNLNCSSGNVFILDDSRFFMTASPPWDWSHINETSIKEVFFNNNIEIIDFYESTFSDRIIIIT